MRSSRPDVDQWERGGGQAYHQVPVWHTCSHLYATEQRHTCRPQCRMDFSCCLQSWLCFADIGQLEHHLIGADLNDNNNDNNNDNDNDNDQLEYHLIGADRNDKLRPLFMICDLSANLPSLDR